MFFVILEKQYADITSLLDALENYDVDAVLIDTFSMASFKTILEIKYMKVKALLNVNTGYGFVLSGASQALKPIITSMVDAKQKVISDFISTMKEKVPV